MLVKVACLVAVFCAVCINAAPRPKVNSISDLSETDLVQKFVEFLHEDKEMATMLKTFEEENSAHLMAKRQAESKDMTGMGTDMPPAKEDGFLDRAAKFVMELMQRFLKWINTD